MDEHEHREEPAGLNDAYGVNLKRLVARELDMDRERMGQESRAIEQALNVQARINEIAMQSLQAFTTGMHDRQNDTRHAGVRKEQNYEERMAELEETFNKNITAANEAISGLASLLAAAGVVGASQQTSGETKGY